MRFRGTHGPSLAGRLEQNGVSDYFPDGADHSYSVEELLGTLRVEPQRTEEELIRILRSIVSESDSEENMFEKATEILTLQPNFMGLGVDLKKLVATVRRRRSKDARSALLKGDHPPG